MESCGIKSFLWYLEITVTFWVGWEFLIKLIYHAIIFKSCSSENQFFIFSIHKNGKIFLEIYIFSWPNVLHHAVLKTSYQYLFLVHETSKKHFLDQWIWNPTLPSYGGHQESKNLLPTFHDASLWGIPSLTEGQC